MFIYEVLFKSYKNALVHAKKRSTGSLPSNKQLKS